MGYEVANRLARYDPKAQGMSRSIPIAGKLSLKHAVYSLAKNGYWKMPLGIPTEIK